MKYLITTLFTLFLALTSITAQFETSTLLYDSISVGPYLTPEKGGYNFVFKTQEMGTMVSTRGQVINSSIPYDVFNHYHIKADGAVDSIFSIVVRSEVDHHYTMYQRGLPKLIQFRVGTSNDYSNEKIESKYPELKSLFHNDELLEIGKIDLKENNYTYSHQTFNKGIVKVNEKKAALDLSSDEGKWINKAILTNPSPAAPLSIVAYGKQISDDKERKYNDLQEFRFLTLNGAGEVIYDEEAFFDRAYEFYNSGAIHDESGRLAGYFMSMLEVSGKANKDYNSAAQKVILFDAEGAYSSETLITLPFEPKSKDAADHKIVKVVKSNDEYSIFLHTPGYKKANVGEGIYTFVDYGDRSEEVAFNAKSETDVEQDLINMLDGEFKSNQDYKYAEQLENGDLLLVACENGTEIKFLQLGSKGELKHTSTSYLLNDINSKKATLSFEHLDNHNLLIVSKVAYEKSVKTSYSIYNGRTGKLRPIQPKEEIASIFSYRNGNEIIIFGSSFEDEKLLHFKMEKLQQKDEGVTTIGRE